MNIVKIIFSSLFGSGVTFLTQIYLADQLEHADYGVYASMMAYSLIAVPLLTFGFEQYLYKFYIDKGSSVYYLKWFANASFFTISILALAVYLNLISVEIAVFFVSQAWLLILLSLYQCAKNYTAFSITSAVIPLLRFGFIFTFLNVYNESIQSVFNGLYWSSILTATYCALSCLRLAVKLDSQRKKYGLSVHGNIVLKDAFDYAFASISFAIYFQGSVIFISKLLSYEEVAIFSAAYLIVTTSYLLPSIVFQKYIIPILHEKMQNVGLCKNIYINLNFFSMVTGLAVSIFIAIFSGVIINIFFNDTYNASVLILKFLSLAVFMKYVSASAAAFMLTNDHVKIKNKMMVFSAILNVVLCWALINLYGVTGAVISVIISELVIGLLYIFYCNRYIFKVSFLQSFYYDSKWEWRELK